jgi:hypothetical protein
MMPTGGDGETTCDSSSHGSAIKNNTTSYQKFQSKLERFYPYVGMRRCFGEEESMASMSWKHGFAKDSK